MNIRRLKIYGITAAAGLVFFVLLAAAGIYKYQLDNKLIFNLSKIVPYPALLVDWEPVRYSVFLEELGVMQRYWTAQRAGNNVFLNIPNKAEMSSLLIEKTVENKIIQIYARRNGLRVGVSEVEEQWRKITNSQEQKNEVNSFLRDMYGWSESEFKERVLQNFLLREKVSLFLKNKYGPSEEELLARANEIENKIRQGANFAALAAQASDDEVTRGNGGQTGYFAVGTLPPPLEKAILELKIGQVSQPVLFGSDYYLFKLEDLLYNDRGQPAQMNIRQIVLKGFDFTAWLEEQKEKMAIYRFL